jgi:hypothetical protein
MDEQGRWAGRWRRVSLWLGTTVAAMGSPVGTAAAEDTTGIVTLARKQRALETTGQLRDVDIDTAQVEIAAPPPIGALRERNAPKIARRPLRRIGKVDPDVLGAEIRAKIADAELCRLKVARAAGMAPSAVKAGEITLHWTIDPSGDTRGTLVFEGTETDLALMKCVRRRMNGWRFSKPSGGSVEVEYDYRFASATR